MSAPAPGLEPEWKPDGDILTALDGIPDEPAHPVAMPTFTPHDRVIREPLFKENRAALKHLKDSVQAIDFDTLDAARANGQSYAAALTAAAAGPLPVRMPGASLGPAAPFDAFAGAGHRVPVPQAEPEADGTWLLDFLGDLLDDAAEGAVRRITTPCLSCTETCGFCEDCQDTLARAARYSRLAELIEAAPGDRGAVLVLMAGVWRQTAPEDATSAAQCGTEDESTSASAAAGAR